MPTVSVIIPNFNNAAYVATAIESVLAQSYQDLEIIVVDDGSTDDSRTVIAPFGERVRYLWQENQGLAGARNSGIRAAQGDWIALLDADDQWLPTYLATLLTLSARDPTGTVYYCAVQCMDSQGYELPRTLGEPRATPETTYQTLLRANFLIPSTILMRRQVVIDAGLFDSKLRSCEDWDLWLRIGANARFVGTPARLVRYRLHNASLSTNLTGMHQAAQAVIEKNFGPDDNERGQWSPTKKRAYGGLYRYFALTLVQRQNHWVAAAQFLRKALQVDETIATDLDLFYELAFGNQPLGYRGTVNGLCIADTATQVEGLLRKIFEESSMVERSSLLPQTYATAYYALGLAAYNTGQLIKSRYFMLMALRHQPALFRDRRLLGNLCKSFATQGMRNRLRRLRRYYQ